MSDDFEFVGGSMNPDDSEEHNPDRRTRPHRSDYAPIKCPNCDEETLRKELFSKDTWSCPCGYTEKR